MKMFRQIFSCLIIAFAISVFETFGHGTTTFQSKLGLVTIDNPYCLPSPLYSTDKKQKSIEVSYVRAKYNNKQIYNERCPTMMNVYRELLYDHPTLCVVLSMNA